PRVALNPTPYATYALNSADGGLWAANGSDIYNTNDGNVGIGTSEPQAMLEVNSEHSGEAKIRLTTAQADDRTGAHLELRSAFSVSVPPGALNPRIVGGLDFLDDADVRIGGIEYRRIDATPPHPLPPDTRTWDYLTLTVGEETHMQFQQEVGAEASNWLKGPLNLEPGDLRLGSMSGPHLRLRTNVIDARDGSDPSPLYLNWHEGDVYMTGGGAPGGQKTVLATSRYDKVGIGTDSPQHKLEVHSDRTGDAAVFITHDDGVGLKVSTDSPTYPAVYISNAGSDHALEVYARAHLYAAARIMSFNGPALELWADSTGPGVTIHQSGTGSGLSVHGDAMVEVLYITGADVAEKFPTSEEVKPGMVMAIDPDHPGKLCLSRGAYNRCVAGVVSGANDLPAGAVLGNVPGNEDAPAVALSGRVWVHCDATGQPIAPGDLLTTAGRTGHAMKVSDFAKAQGAVLGKAMTALDEGTGLVLVLVSLQ
ncbi:MAG: hypothetical protein JSU63_08075, partial [Phycisphaerales bacterium]